MKTDPSAVAYSYLRFSEPGRQARGQSIARQIANRDDWLKRNPRVRLDETLRMRDEGVSGLSGEHRRNPKFALAQFLALVEEGTVKPGSFLIVENLDRLTREHPRESLRWVLDLIAAGVRIVQLVPFEQVYDSSMGERELVLMLSELARGHAESMRKSTLIGPLWAEKKRLAREGVPYGKQVPRWLALVNGKYVLAERFAPGVRLAFRLSAEGLGHCGVARELNSRSIPAPSYSGLWTRGYVARTLSNRAVLGEYQPYSGSKRRKREGEPIPNYFPAVVTEAEWYAAQAAKTTRAGSSGRPTRAGGVTSPFAGLLCHAPTGERLICKMHRKRRVLIPSSVHEGTATRPACSFPLDSLVSGLLEKLREIRSAELFSDPGAAALAVADGRLEEARKRLAVARERFRVDRESAVWAEEVSVCDRQVRALEAEREAIVRETSNPASESWQQALREMRRNDPGRLRACLLATVASVQCVFHASGADRLAMVQVWFRGGEARRDYLIWHRTRYGVDAQRNAPAVRVKSPADLLPIAFDLRDRQQAAACEVALSEVDCSRL